MNEPKPKEESKAKDSKQEMPVTVTEEIHPPAPTPASPAAAHAACNTAALPLTPGRRETDEQRKKRCKALAAAWRATDPAAADAAWSAAQQAALDGALAAFPSSLPPRERWTQIAAAVAGKDMRACVARFKLLRQRALDARAAWQS